MIKGVDLSSIIEIEKHGGKYYLDNKEKDILDIMNLQKGLVLIKSFTNIEVIICMARLPKIFIFHKKHL